MSRTGGVDEECIQQYPSAMGMAATNATQLAFDVAAATAQELSACGQSLLVCNTLSPSESPATELMKSQEPSKRLSTQDRKSTLTVPDPRRTIAPFVLRDCCRCS